MAPAHSDELSAELERAIAERDIEQIGASYERWLDARFPEGRKQSGVFYTPGELVEHVLDLALDPAIAEHKAAHLPWHEFRVADLAMGVGRFLLPAVRRIAAAFEVDEAQAAQCVYGYDIDAQAVAIAARLLPAANLQVADGLTAEPNVAFDVVLGNPPFLNRAELRTKSSDERNRELRARYGSLWGAYTNPATLFQVRSMELAKPDGRVALVQPESFLGTRDSNLARQWLTGQGALTHLWISRVPVFGAAVRTVVPVFMKGARQSGVARTVELPVKPLPEVSLDLQESAWGPLLADAYGVPALPRMQTQGEVADLAEVSAGFLQDYYALAPLLREFLPGDLKVATSGAVRFGQIGWGESHVRLGKRALAAPGVDVAALNEVAEVRAIFRNARKPKLLLATQTKAIQFGLDRDGEFVASVPLITVVPRAEHELAKITALLLTPALSVLAAQRSLGTGLAGGVIKLSAEQVRSLPLPKHERLWREAAALLADSPPLPQGSGLIAAAKLMNRAYGVAPDYALDWWLVRLGRATSL